MVDKIHQNSVKKSNKELWKRMFKEFKYRSVTLLTTKHYEIGLTLFLLSIPTLFKILKRKSSLFVTYPHSLYLNSVHLSRGLIENNGWINMKFARALTVQKFVDKVSYKESEAIEQTYVLAIPRSIFTAKQIESNDDVLNLETIWEDSQIVKLELAGTKHPWPIEAVGNFNKNLINGNNFE